jgi:predicted PurR-regulated permease PerM
MAFTLVAWAALAVGAIWLLAHIIEAILLYLLAGIVAYAIAPIVRRLEQFFTRRVSVALAYAALLCALVGLLAVLVVTALHEWADVAKAIDTLAAGPNTQPLYSWLGYLGLTSDQVHDALQYVDRLAHPGLGTPTATPTPTPTATPAAGGTPTAGATIEPLSAGMAVANVIGSAVLIGIISAYFVTEGNEFRKTLRDSIPIQHREHVRLVIQTLDKVVGGYIRAQLKLSLLIGVLVGVGMWALRVPGPGDWWTKGVPRPLFLGALAFVLEFIPMVGLWITGAVCVLVALTQSPTLALMALIYFIIASVIEANVAAPRILAEAVDIHPMVSLFALLAGAQLFGLWGAAFAAYWSDWRTTHPEQFPPDDEGGVGLPVPVGAPSQTPGTA